MTTNAQTIGKEAPAYPDNEDSYCVDSQTGVWCVADGAGGTGLYAGQWARFLVEQIPDKPFGDFSALAHWLDERWATFFAEFQPQAATHYLTERKFMDEGSGATLATLHQRADTLHWMVYGDAVMLCFNNLSEKLHVAKPGLAQFETAPYLLNWNSAPQPNGFACGQWLHEPGNSYALLSDTLGQFVLMAHNALSGNWAELTRLAQTPTALGQRAARHRDFWTGNQQTFHQAVWKPMRDSLASRDTFAAYTQHLRIRNLLGADDYTAVLIDSVT